MDAYEHPDFYRQLGRGKDQMIGAAIERLQALVSITLTGRSNLKIPACVASRSWHAH